MYAIPDTLIQTTTELHGEAAGQQWLEQLPRILSDCAARWSLDLQPPFPNLTYNYAAPATRGDGTPVVIKAGFIPLDKEFMTEMAALTLFKGRGAVQLLDTNPEQGVMLLERLDPGTPIGELESDEEAISVAAAVLRQLWQPVPALQSNLFPLTSDWGKGFARLRVHYGGGTGPFPTTLVERAERLFAELEATKGETVLLHGDLNFGNVRSAQREPWLAIDPKGVIGETVYDTGIFLRDPITRILTAPQPERFLARRIDQLAEELGFERERIRDWGLTQAVLSAWWFVEDGGAGWEPALTCAQLLAQIR